MVLSKKGRVWAGWLAAAVLFACQLSPTAAGVEAPEPPMPTSLPDCKATLQDARKHEIGGMPPFVFIGAEPDTSLQDCAVTAFYRLWLGDSGKRDFHIVVRRWAYPEDYSHAPVMTADSRACPAIVETLKSLEAMEAPRNSFPIPSAKADRPPKPIKITLHPTILTFSSKALAQPTDLSGAIQHLEFSTIDFPESPITQCLQNELPNLEQCWQPGENEEEYPIELEE